MKKPLRYDPHLTAQDHALWRYRFRNSWTLFFLMLVLAIGAGSLLFLFD